MIHDKCVCISSETNVRPVILSHSSSPAKDAGVVTVGSNDKGIKDIICVPVSWHPEPAVHTGTGSNLFPPGRSGSQML